MIRPAIPAYRLPLPRGPERSAPACRCGAPFGRPQPCLPANQDPGALARRVCTGPERHNVVIPARPGERVVLSAPTRERAVG